MPILRVKNDTLYTPLRVYGKGELEVTLLGMIHLADPSYYQRAQAIMDQHPEGFFEGVRPGSDAALNERVESVIAYDRVAKMLGLVAQPDTMTYGPGWKNADLDLDQIAQSAGSGFERLLSLMEKAVDMVEKSYAREPEKVRNEGRRSMMKMARIASFLGITPLMPYASETIIRERNRELYRHLRPRLRSGEPGKIGITYGAGHLNGIEKFLTHEGFEKIYGAWMPAFSAK